MAKRNSKLRLDVQMGLNSLPKSALGPASGHEFVKAYFPLAKTVLRIATGYFSVKGYDIGLEHLATPDVLLHFLVGPKEGTNVRDAVAKRIRLELRRGNSGNLVAAVEDLIQRIREGKFVIQDAREVSQLFHCKFYMCDEQYVWHGSANFSEKGLLKQAEQVEASTDAELLERWLVWFEEVASKSRNLMDEVLDELEGWLKLVSPFDAYLKALLVLFGFPETPYRRGAHQPTYYQKALVARTIRRLADYRGSLLVVATGLGKTVIGAEIAGQLHRVRACDSILLIAPSTVHRAWKKQLVLTRRLPAQIFGSNALFNKTGKKAYSAANELDEELRNADSKTLIIIDEAQYYRNELHTLNTKHRSEVYQRLQPALAQGAQVVLLTGSVYGTSMQNVNSLLRLLPPRPIDNADEPTVPWEVDTCEELAQLPIVSVLGIPHVLKMARLRNDLDAEQHPFIEFTNSQQQTQRNYLPRIIHSRLVAYIPPLRNQVLRVLDGKCCDQSKPFPTKNYDDEAGEYVDGLTNNALRQAIYSWLSSPLAFINRLQKNLQTPGEHDEQIILNFNTHTTSNTTATQGILDLDLAPRIIAVRVTSKSRKKVGIDRYKGNMKLSQQERQEHLALLWQVVRQRAWA